MLRSASLGLLVGMLGCHAAAMGQEAPTSAHTIGTPDEIRQLSSARVSQLYRLDAGTVSSGALKALVRGREEVVQLADLERRASAGETFFQVTGPAREVAVPIELRSQAFPAERAIRLGYRFNARTVSENSTAYTSIEALLTPSNGLFYSGARRAYVATLGVRLLNVADPADHSVLERPIQLFVRAPRAMNIDPDPLAMNTLGSWQGVSITVASIDAAPYRVAVRASEQDKGDEIDIDVVAPRIQIRSSSPSILGWGIGKTTLTLEAVGMLDPQGFVIDLRSHAGGLSDGRVTLDERGRGSTELRSTSAPRTVIQLQNEGFSSEPLVVEFSTPWIYLLAALAGGAVGAFVRGRGRERWPMALAVGAASGVLMTLAYAVGIDWLAAVLPNAVLAQAGEAVVFVLSAIGALLGVGRLAPVGQAPEPSNPSP